MRIPSTAGQAADIIGMSESTGPRTLDSDSVSSTQRTGLPQTSVFAERDSEMALAGSYIAHR